MDPRFGPLAALAADSHGALSRQQLRAAGLSDATVHRWTRNGLLVRLGRRSFSIGGSPPTWHRSLAAGLIDAGPHAALAGRSGARLLGLDGFGEGPPEALVHRAHRLGRSPGTVGLHTTGRPIERADVCRVDGLRTLRAERLILEAPLFGFSRDEIENAIDSAIRLRLVSEPRLRSAVERFHTRGVNGGRALVDALVDMGGESRLERHFLRLVREAGLPRPRTQVVHRRDGRQVARVDFLFEVDLVVEVDGHRTHSSRRRQQADAQRRNDLTLVGRRVVTFTFGDVTGRPAWVVAQLEAHRQMA